MCCHAGIMQMDASSHPLCLLETETQTGKQEFEHLQYMCGDVCVVEELLLVFSPHTLSFPPFEAAHMLISSKSEA